MNPEGQFRVYKPDYTGMKLEEFEYIRMKNCRGTLEIYHLDVMWDQKERQEPYDLAIFVHGGGFVKPNDKRQAYIPEIARHLVKEGFAVISPDYPVFDTPEERDASPGAGFYLEKAAEAIHQAYRFAMEHAEDLHLKKERAVLMGGSAGGMGCFYAIAKYPGEYGAFINLWGTPEKLPKLEQFPPTLTVHGDQDPLVPYELSKALQQKLKAAGIVHALHTVKGKGHTPVDRLDEYLGEILQYAHMEQNS